jgi:peroxiredoxin Q/BCP
MNIPKLFSVSNSMTDMKLKVGDAIPEFDLQDEQGVLRSLKAPFEKKIVFFFYPKDNTPGCTMEACAFRDAYEDFSKEGVDIYGISNDSPESHRNFKQRNNLPYPLLSDPNGRLREAFGVKKDFFGLIPGRVTYIVDEKGVVRHIYKSHLNMEGHIRESLEAVRKISVEA